MRQVNSGSGVRRDAFRGLVLGKALGLILLGAAVLMPAVSGVAVVSAATVQEVAVAQKKTVNLGPKFVAGHETVYEHFSTITSSQEQLDGNKKSQGVFGSTTSTTLIMRVRVVEVYDGGGATVEMKYDHIMTEGDGFFTGPYSFDSDNDPANDSNPRIGQALRKLLDATIVAEVDADGIVASVTGCEEAAQAIEFVDTIQTRSNEFKPDSLKQMLQSFWRIGDEKREREEGEKWVEQQEMELGGLGTLLFISKFGVKEITDGTATLDFRLDLMLDVDEQFKMKAQPEQDEAAEAGDGAGGDGGEGGQAYRGPSQDQDDVGSGADDAEGQDDADGADDGPEGQDMEPQYIPIKDARLEVKPLPGHFVWDIARHELIERETALSFELTTEQAGLFELEITTVQKNDVKTSLKRLSVK